MWTQLLIYTMMIPTSWIIPTWTIKDKEYCNFLFGEMKDFDERLIIKLPVKADAERQYMRKKKRTEEQVEKDKTVQRVCKVAQRAGGLTEARMADLRAGQKKNKGSSVYSGDALRNQDILQGTFIVDQLSEGTPDSLGALGTSQCSFCGALKCCQIANIFL